MLKVGLTGNMGSGKSTVARIFHVLQIPVYHADQIAKKSYTDPGIRKNVTRLFGDKILDPAGLIDIKALAQIVFQDHQTLKKLTGLIHPYVLSDFRNWILLHQSAPYVVHESAIIFESGFRHEYDHIIHVSCPQEIAILRITARDGLTREAILQRMKHQMTDPHKCNLSDFVIRNDDRHLVIPQVLAIHQTLIQANTQRNH